MLVLTFLTLTPWERTCCGNCGSALLTAFCTRCDSDVEVRSDGKRHSEGVAAIAAAGGLHVNRALDAVDTLLDGDTDGVGHGFGASAGIGGGDLDCRRDDLRILRHRQVV